MTKRPKDQRKAIAYVRVSTVDQATNGVSLAAQRAKIEAWCELNDYELVEVLVERGKSGRRADNRAKLQTALDAVCACGGVLVVYSLSRLARSTKDTLLISERLQGCGADLVSLSEDINTISAAGKMVFRMMSVLAEFESDVISERTKLAMAYKKANGAEFGAEAYGTEPNEAKTLIQIKRLRSKGWVLRRIATHLNEKGIPTKRGKVWMAGNVASVLKTSS